MSVLKLYLKCQDKKCKSIISRKSLGKLQFNTWRNVILKCKTIKKSNKKAHTKCVDRHTKKLFRVMKSRDNCAKKHCKTLRRKTLSSLNK